MMSARKDILKMANSLADVVDSPFDKLPVELLETVIAALDDKSRAQLAQTSRRMREAVGDFDRRTGRTITPEQLDEQLRLIGVANPAQWTRERFLGGLWFLNNEEGIDATGVVPEEGNHVFRCYIKGNRQYCISTDSLSELFKERASPDAQFELHRPDGLPAITEWHQDKSTKTEEYWQHARRSRDNDTPAVIKWYDNGRVWYVDYYIDGEQRRSDPSKPVSREWYKEGNLYRERYIVDGRGRTRYWDRDGQPIERRFF
jgi:hypothetical protein